MHKQILYINFYKIINVKKTLNKIFNINIYFEIYEYKYEIIYVNKFFFEYLIDNKTFFLIVNVKYAINNTWKLSSIN